MQNKSAGNDDFYGTHRAPLSRGELHDPVKRGQILARLSCLEAERRESEAITLSAHLIDEWLLEEAVQAIDLIGRYAVPDAIAALVRLASKYREVGDLAEVHEILTKALLLMRSIEFGWQRAEAGCRISTELFMAEFRQEADELLNESIDIAQRAQFAGSAQDRIDSSSVLWEAAVVAVLWRSVGFAKGVVERIAESTKKTRALQQIAAIDRALQKAGSKPRPPDPAEA